VAERDQRHLPGTKVTRLLWRVAPSSQRL
jgi:hypothetical protein